MPELAPRKNMDVADEELTPDEQAACDAITRVLLTLPRVIDARLLRSTDLTLAEYSVLVGLTEAPRRTARISDLSLWVPMSRSGLTRLVDRLVRQGIVERRQAVDDRRSQLVVLTEAGAELAEAARVAHQTCLRQLILDHLHGLDLTGFTSAFEKMVR